MAVVDTGWTGTRTGADGKTIHWQVMIDTRDGMSGKRKRIVVGTLRRKKEADAAERQAMIERDRGTLLKADKATVAELFDK